MKTTKKHFDLFRKEFKKWRDFYGCFGWELVFEWEPKLDLNENDAEIEYKLRERVAIVRLAGETTRSDIKYLAFHEATELFLARIRRLARERFVTEEEINEEVNAILGFLEREFYRPKDGRDA